MTFTFPGLSSIWDFYFDISEWHILPACMWTPALMLYLTNPCAKWMVLSLTKPKGKIYQTKSLRHYITISPHPKKTWILVMKEYLNLNIIKCWILFVPTLRLLYKHSSSMTQVFKVHQVKIKLATLLYLISYANHYIMIRCPPMVVPVNVPAIDHIDLLENYLYLIEILVTI